MNGEWRADIIQAFQAACSRNGNVSSAKGRCFPPETIQQTIAGLGKMIWAELTGERNRKLGILKLRVQHREHAARWLRYSNIHSRAALNTNLNAGASRVSGHKSKA